VTAMRGEMLYLTQAQVTEPPEGLVQVYRNAWWSVDIEGNVALYRSGPGGALHPQCNQSRTVAERLGPRTLGEKYAGVVQLPVAFVTVHLEDY
jgi:hypothetical protein